MAQVSGNTDVAIGRRNALSGRYPSSTLNHEFTDRQGSIMRKRITVILLLRFLSSGCRFDDICRIKIDGGDEVVFVFSGGGRLVRFRVQDITADDHGEYPKEEAVWKIKPKDEGRWVFDIDSITYGVTPEGYEQVVPSKDKRPEQLHDGTYM